MGTPERAPILANISVAAPCHAKWSEMTGDERARFCLLCSKHVYNLSAMSRAEAEALVKEKEGKVCVRFYRRADGTVITDNCPVGLRAVRDRLRWIGAGVAAVFGILAAGVVSLAGARGPSLRSWFVESVDTGAVMGKMRCVIPPSPPAPSGPPASSNSQ